MWVFKEFSSFCCSWLVTSKKYQNAHHTICLKVSTIYIWYIKKIISKTTKTSFKANQKPFSNLTPETTWKEKTPSQLPEVPSTIVSALATIWLQLQKGPWVRTVQSTLSWIPDLQKSARSSWGWRKLRSTEGKKTYMSYQNSGKVAWMCISVAQIQL